ncbi:MAG: hypothetical protein U9N45_08270, partial [Gemmatimonadota bacterium]|nr:hypothetical protein [Gemmatimonadota bacterium]
MSKDSYTRSRRKHLKNLRKIQKSTRSISGSTDTRRKSSSRSDSMINLGLVFGAVVLVILLGSAILEYKGNISTHLFNKTGREKSALLKVNPEAVEVRVLSGCGVAGASRNMMSYLRDLHFDVVY